MLPVVLLRCLKKLWAGLKGLGQRPAPVQILRVLFALSVLASLFHGLAISLFYVLHREAPSDPATFLISAVVTLGVCRVAFGQGRLAVASSTPLWRLVVTLAVTLLASYVLLAPICGVVMWGLVQLTHPDPSHPELGTLVLLVAIYYPLFLSPAVAAAATWFILTRRYAR